MMNGVIMNLIEMSGFGQTIPQRLMYIITVVCVHRSGERFHDGLKSRGRLSTVFQSTPWCLVDDKFLASFMFALASIAPRRSAKFRLAPCKFAPARASTYSTRLQGDYREPRAYRLTRQVGSA